MDPYSLPRPPPPPQGWGSGHSSGLNPQQGNAMQYHHPRDYMYTPDDLVIKTLTDELDFDFAEF
ncbi:hypothetical protein SPRG_11561 [Saprolegnia parasitica CBS 223.65]|uniref:Uncharacterized protein n=1 Tax=Saprolegnia parasitica (strain CBS 223.65) TaxID=695850 RepID=A0A067BX16_SAPPC|nr:hypothetical protein SPRG_11561 [Saprolegnia parasitica CBS 223.65]KDO22803.1 hypothetical protein SPRG_11561 [Saprolegnia parasitica CBS 223.65]|eukprot:XP_012206475.1 hypothetical protein SPRG_11561 [Saprolegnia parasitica CBS 223.65]